MIVEPGGLVFGEPRGQNLGLPRTGWRLKPFELPDQDLDCVRPLHAGIRRNPLPVEEEAQEVACRDRLDLGAQTAHRVAVDACEQPALAPLLNCSSPDKTSAQGEAFRLERCEPECDILRLHSERRRQRIRCGRPKAFEPTAKDFSQRFIGRPLTRGVFSRSGNRRVEPGCRPQRLKLR